VGAKPIFVDIDPLTFNIDPTQITAKITPQTAAIMPVHLYGHPAAMAQILEIAQTYDLKVIEDCAQAFGACYFQDHAGNTKISDSICGKAVGTIGDVGAYSFFPSKNLGAYGDGGLITTDQDAVAQKARMLRVHGALKKYHNEMLGYNSRLDTIQAAILRVKLPHIDHWNQARRQAAQSYNELLASVAGIVTPHLVEGHVFHQYTIRVLDGKRDALQQQLAEQGIGSMVYYPVPQDQLPVYQGKYQSYEISHQLSQEVLSLPIWPEIELEKQVHIVKVLISALS
jgi:dTDP-4-amino-4,6-dideoxygalactose transaminase